MQLMYLYRDFFKEVRMDYYNNIKDYTSKNNIICIGKFDGVHLVHEDVIKEIKR